MEMRGLGKVRRRHSIMGRDDGKVGRRMPGWGRSGLGWRQDQGSSASLDSEPPCLALWPNMAAQWIYSSLRVAVELNSPLWDYFIYLGERDDRPLCLRSCWRLSGCVQVQDSAAAISVLWLSRCSRQKHSPRATFDSFAILFSTF